ncbi:MULTISPECIES: hypothetical protein [unclassified Streptomyces]|uniref:hypothetical protein n=1 Tax=unclassified Streptomyces TaxID=2593676 RepID=UPI000B15B7AE|nr:hypothetical protein [Streptomyces sp. TSRI0107]
MRIEQLVSVSHGRGDIVSGGIAVGVDSHHPCETGFGQAVLGEECGDGVAEGDIAVDRVLSRSSNSNEMIGSRLRPVISEQGFPSRIDIVGEADQGGLRAAGVRARAAWPQDAPLRCTAG